MSAVTTNKNLGTRIDFYYCKLCACSTPKLIEFDCCNEGKCCETCCIGLYGSTISTYGLFICPVCDNDVLNL